MTSLSIINNMVLNLNVLGDVICLKCEHVKFHLDHISAKYERILLQYGSFKSSSQDLRTVSGPVLGFSKTARPVFKKSQDLGQASCGHCDLPSRIFWVFGELSQKKNVTFSGMLPPQQIP